ncbi:gamma-glutamyltransferase [Caldithrix abyssi]
MKNRWLLFILLTSIVFWLDPLVAQNFSPVKAKRAMVVTADRLASEAGVEVLKKGGNAVDAAVAVAFTLAVTYPNAGNLGGGGFMLIRTPENQIFALDYREKAPLKATRDMYLDAQGNVIPEASLIGYRASGVPGTVYGLWEAHKRFGKLRWNELLKPAIRYASKGFLLNAYQAGLLNWGRIKFEKFPSSKRIFMKEEGAFEEGDKLVQKDLAAVLKRIARKGVEDFYRGKTARLIAADMRRNGGLITLEDLAQYRAVWREPVLIDYRGYKVYSMPLPSSGGILLAEILNTIEKFNVQALGLNSYRYIHLLTEIERQAYRDRAIYLGDPDFVSAPVEKLISKQYADSIKARLSLLTAGRSQPQKLTVAEESTQTTHFSIVDEQGWAVSNTYTLNGNYGSGVVIEGTGILMNNEMDDFSIKPGHPNMFGLVGSRANAIEPGKRMLSSMTPTIVLRNDSLFMVLGSPGGSKIITSVAQVLINVIDFKLNIRRAVEAPRFHHQWLPDQIFLENYGFSRDAIHNLHAAGYRTSFVESMGLVQAILVKDNIYQGWSDPRGPGMAKGF